MKAGAILRIARPTDHLAAIAAMYATGLDFTVLAQFHDHDGFDGIILGHPQHPYHLEFTTHRGHQVGNALRNIICWSSIFRIRTSGKPVVPACWERDFTGSRRIIPMGMCVAGPLRISMDIGLCSRTQRGLCRGSWVYYGTTSRFRPSCL
jgi:hypothetical protein